MTMCLLAATRYSRCIQTASVMTCGCGWIVSSSSLKVTVCWVWLVMALGLCSAIVICWTGTYWSTSMTLLAIGSISVYSWPSSSLTVCSLESPSWNSYSRTSWQVKSKISLSTVLSHSRTQTVLHMHFGHSLILIRTSFQTQCFAWIMISRLSIIMASRVKSRTYSQSVTTNESSIVSGRFLISCTCRPSRTKSILSPVWFVSHCLVKYNCCYY